MMPMVSTLLWPDRGFCSDVDGDTLTDSKPGAKPRCQGEGSFGLPRWGWSASHSLELRALASDSVAWKLGQNKHRSLPHRLRGVVVDCSGCAGCGQGYWSMRRLRCLCMCPERAGGGFEGDDVLSSEREDEAELEHMMGNARTAPRYSAVKQYVLKGWGKCDRCGWRNSYLC